MSKSQKIWWLGAGTSIASVLLYLWAQFVEPNQLELTHTDIDFVQLPRELDGLRILFLSDAHVQSWSRRETSVLNLLCNSMPASPELILWGGDYLFNSGETENCLRLVQEVQKLFPSVPSFGVLGNAEHKFRRPRTLQFVEELENRGVRVLLNESVSVSLRNVSITLIGVDDPYYGYDDLHAARKEADLDCFTILLSHSPQIVYPAARSGVDLMISGHTHGGQLRLPFLGAIKAQNPLGRKLDQGVFDAERLQPVLQRRTVPANFRLYITRGIGVAQMLRFSWIRPRLLCPPEISLLRLRHRQ